MLPPTNNPMSAATLWRVSHGDVVMHFDDEAQAKHNFDAFKRAGLNPTMQEYRLVSTTTDH